MSENEKEILVDAVLNFDGWVVSSAEGEVSPFEHEDVAGTKAFFGKFLAFSRDEQASSEYVQPA